MHTAHACIHTWGGGDSQYQSSCFGFVNTARDASM
jgi:hypothetical protein